MRIESLSNEFNVMISLLNHDAENDIELLLKNQKSINWSALLQQIQWHRMAGVVQMKLRGFQQFFPKSFINGLESQVVMANARTLRSIYTLRSINRHFNDNKLEFMVFKGPVLSRELYNSNLTRISNDLDILVAPESIPKAHMMLQQLGFQLANSNLDPESPTFKRYMKYSKDVVYITPDYPSQIELHWRLDKNEQTFPVEFDTLWGRGRDFSINNIDIKTFSKEDNFVYLICHGSISLWGRLQWLYDIDRLFRLSNQPNWSLVSARIRQMGCGRMLGLTQSLCKHLFNSPVPNDIEYVCNMKRINSLQKLIINHLNDGNYAPRHIRIKSRLQLKPELSYKLSYVKTIVSNLMDGRPN